MSSSDHKLSAFEKWELPAVNLGSDSVFNSISHPPSARQLEEIISMAQKDGYEQGLKQGKENGYRDALAEKKQAIEVSLNNLTGIMDALTMPVRDIDEDLVEQIFNIIGMICKRIILIEIERDRRVIFSIIEQAINELPVNNVALKIKLNPVDAEFIMQQMSDDDSDYTIAENITIIRDENIDTGGCVVVSGKTVVDSRLSTRIDRMVSEHYAPE